MRKRLLTLVCLLLTTASLVAAQDTFVTVTDVVGGIYHLPLANCPTQGLTYTRSTNSFGCVSGASAPAGGSDTQVQFNDGGVLGGDAGFTYVKATDTATLGALVLTTALPATSGGTGFASYAVGDLLYASTTTALAKRAAVAVGQVLTSAGVGTAPAWSGSPTLTGTLAMPSIANSNANANGNVLFLTSGTSTATYTSGLAIALNGAATAENKTSLELFPSNNIAYRGAISGVTVSASGGSHEVGLAFAGQAQVFSTTFNEWMRMDGRGRFGLNNGTTAMVQRFTVTGGGARFNYSAAPSAVVGALAGAGAGNLTNGAYTYKVMFVTANGNSLPSAASNTVTVADATTDGKIALTSIPVSTNFAYTSRIIGRTKAGGSVYFIQSTIGDNTTTTLTDNTADSGLTSLLQTNGTDAGGLWAGTTKALQIDSTGLVGASSAEPVSSLTVGNTGTGSVRGLVSAQWNTGAQGAMQVFRKARNVEVAPNVIVTADLLGTVIAEGYDGSNYIQSAGIDFVSTGTIATTRVPSVINFYTGTDAAPTVKTLAATIGADQSVILIGLKTTGAATGKTVVCVDVTTGKLYASSSAVACAN